MITQAQKQIDDLEFFRKRVEILSGSQLREKDRIISAIERIRLRPDSYVTKLVGDAAYRLRVGDYRVLLDIEDDKLLILVIKIGHRKYVL